jgi:hypothetical protein
LNVSVGDQLQVPSPVSEPLETSLTLTQKNDEESHEQLDDGDVTVEVEGDDDALLGSSEKRVPVPIVSPASDVAFVPVDAATSGARSDELDADDDRSDEVRASSSTPASEQQQLIGVPYETADNNSTSDVSSSSHSPVVDNAPQPTANEVLVERRKRDAQHQGYYYWDSYAPRHGQQFFYGGGYDSHESAEHGSEEDLWVSFIHCLDNPEDLILTSSPFETERRINK